jgi:hypothetical protein
MKGGLDGFSSTPWLSCWACDSKCHVQKSKGVIWAERKTCGLPGCRIRITHLQNQLCEAVAPTSHFLTENIFVNRQIHQVHAPESKGLQVSRKVTLPFSFAQEEQSYEAEPHMDANKEKPALCVVFCVLHVVFCVVCVVGVVCCAYMDV